MDKKYTANDIITDIKMHDFITYEDLLSLFSIYDEEIVICIFKKIFEQISKKEIGKKYLEPYLYIKYHGKAVNDDTVLSHLCDEFGDENVIKYFSKITNDDEENIYNVSLEQNSNNIEIPYSSDSVKSYLKEIGEIPLLTREEEVSLFNKRDYLRNSVSIASYLDSKTIFNDLYSILLSIDTKELWDKLNKINKIKTKDSKIISSFLGLFKWNENGENNKNVIPSKDQIEQKLGVDLSNVTPICHDKLNKQFNLIIECRNVNKKIVNANLRLVVNIAKHYYFNSFDLMDLVQYGNMGLMRAVDRFDVSLNRKFSTYATWWIRQSISRSLSDLGRTIRIPVHVTELDSKIRKVIRNYLQEYGVEPNNETIAKMANIPLEKVEYIRENIAIPSISSLDTPVNTEDSDDTLLGDFIESPNADVYEIALRDERAQNLRKAIDLLSEREKLIVMLRFGLADPLSNPNSKEYTLEQIGNMLGLTRERVRQIEAKSLRKLRNPREAKYYK